VRMGAQGTRLVRHRNISDVLTVGGRPACSKKILATQGADPSAIDDQRAGICRAALLAARAGSERENAGRSPPRTNRGSRGLFFRRDSAGDPMDCHQDRAPDMRRHGGSRKHVLVRPQAPGTTQDARALMVPMLRILCYETIQKQPTWHRPGKKVLIG